MKFNFENQFMPSVISATDETIALYPLISNETLVPCKVLDFDHVKELIKISYIDPRIQMHSRVIIKEWVPMDFISIIKR